MINVTDVAIMTSYLMAWTNTHTALARKMKDRNGALKGAIQMETVELYECMNCEHFDVSHIDPIRGEVWYCDTSKCEFVPKKLEAEVTDNEST